MEETKGKERRTGIGEKDAGEDGSLERLVETVSTRRQLVETPLGIQHSRGPLPVDEWTITSTRTASTVEKNPLRPVPNRETNGPPLSTCYSRCIIRAEIQGPLSLLLRPTSKLGCALGSRVRRSPFLLRRQETPIDRSFGGFY
ncbi:hypothetical protein BHE74_00006741 [Ensete ventricosum]|nr:hypothetical protein BHE74_00006741 [Ensete ventricosum]